MNSSGPIAGRTGKGSTMADEQPSKPKRLTELSHCAG